MRQIITHPITLVVVACCALFVYISLDRSAEKADHSSAYLQTLEKERAALATEVQELQKKHAQAQTPFAQEKIIRNELLRQKPDEVVLTLPTTATDSSKEEAPPTLHKTPWQQWKTILFE